MVFNLFGSVAPHFILLEGTPPLNIPIIDDFNY